MLIKIFSKSIPFFLLLFVATQFLTISPVLAASGDVNAVSRITIGATEEEGFLKALTRIGGQVVGKVVGSGLIVLELFWPDKAGGIAWPILCIGQTCVNEGEMKSVSFTPPASYTVSWKVLEQQNVKCYAFDQAMSLNASVSFFESLPTVGQVSYAPNTRWLGSRSEEGGEIAYTNKPVGDYWYNFTCYEKQSGGWLTKAIDAITIFGTVSQRAYFTRQQTLHVVVGSSEPAPAPAPILLPPVVAFLANPGVVNQGQPSILSWGTSDATSCTGSASPPDANWSGSITPVGGGRRTVTPSQTTTYTLSCTGPGGSTRKSIQVTVIPTSAAPPPAGPGCFPQIDIKIQ